MESNNKLKRGLSTRHIRFMALGSAIGTGLFYGSADAIKMAGPSVLLAYIIGGSRHISLCAHWGNVRSQPCRQLIFALCAGKPRPACGLYYRLDLLF